MKNIIEIAKKELVRNMTHEGLFIDITLGSGNESLELARYNSEGRVFSFGSTNEIEIACKLFESSAQENIRFINDSPLNLKNYITGAVDLAMCRITDDSKYDVKELIGSLSLILSELVGGGRLLLINHNSRFDGAVEYLSKLSYREFFVSRFSSPNDYSAPKAVLVEKR